MKGEGRWNESARVELSRAPMSQPTVHVVKGASVRGASRDGHAVQGRGDTKGGPRHFTGIGKSRVGLDVGSGKTNPELAGKQGGAADAGCRQDVELQVVGGAHGVGVASASGRDEGGTSGGKAGPWGGARGQGRARKGGTSASASAVKAGNAAGEDRVGAGGNGERGLRSETEERNGSERERLAATRAHGCFCCGVGGCWMTQ